MLSVKSKKGEMNAGLISSLIFGIASLVIGVVIAFTVVSTLSGADLLTSSRDTSATINETEANVNASGYTLVNSALDQAIPGTYVITALWNGSADYNSVVPVANVSVSSVGVVTNSTLATYGNLSISYTVITYAGEELSSRSLSGNLSSGVDNVSKKIPTVLTVAAVVLILGVLVLLVAAWQRMRLGGGSI